MDDKREKIMDDKREKIISGLINMGYERDESGFGYGKRSMDGIFVRIPPFWISDKRIEETL